MNRGLKLIKFLSNRVAREKLSKKPPFFDSQCFFFNKKNPSTVPKKSLLLLLRTTFHLPFLAQKLFIKEEAFVNSAKQIFELANLLPPLRLRLCDVDFKTERRSLIKL